MREPEFIKERTVNPQRMTVVSFDLPFRNELPTKLSAAMLQQSLKRRANRALMRDTDGLELP
jgi:rRNA maturation protein Rpf1